MKKFGIEIKWAINFSIITLLWMILEHSLGWHDENIGKHAIYTNFFIIIAIFTYFIAIKDKKDNFYARNMTFRKGFVSGVMLSIFIAILSPIVQYISFKFIAPNFFENIINYTVTHKIQTQIQAEDYFNLKSYTIQGFFGSLSMGVVTSAIIAYFLKSKPIKQ